MMSTYLDHLALFALDIIFRGCSILGFLGFAVEHLTYSPVVFRVALRLLWLLSMSFSISEECIKFSFRVGSCQLALGSDDLA